MENEQSDGDDEADDQLAYTNDMNESYFDDNTTDMQTVNSSDQSYIVPETTERPGIHQKVIGKHFYLDIYAII